MSPGNGNKRAAGLTSCTVCGTRRALEFSELPYFSALLIAIALLLLWAMARKRGRGGTATVTFDVTLPADTPPADAIYVAGDFQGWDPRATPLVRISATHARGTVTLRVGSAIEFKFTRGDWARSEMSADCSPMPNRTVVLPRSATVNVTVGKWADLCIAVYDQRARKVQIESRALGVKKEFYVYVPPGYAEAPQRRYPALYLFRGHESEWINKHQDPSRAGRNVIDFYEELLAAGEVGPMLLVFPGMTSADETIPGMATNFRSPELTTAQGIGTGRFEDYLLELIAYVDANYRTVATKAGRGVDGFSLGGFMSVKIAARHPELFTTVGAFDGTHFYAAADGAQVDLGRDAVTFMDPMFDAAFGSPRDAHFGALNNGPNLIRNADASTMQSLHWFVQYGAEASEPSDSNFYRGEHLIDELKRKGITNQLPSVLNGRHNWATADEHMRVAFPLHWQALNAAAAGDVNNAGAKHTSANALG